MLELKSFVESAFGCGSASAYLSAFSGSVGFCVTPTVVNGDVAERGPNKPVLVVVVPPAANGDGVELVAVGLLNIPLPPPPPPKLG